MITFLDVMDFWPTPAELANDLGSKIARVQKWRARKKIPSDAWPAVVEAAKRRGFPISAETLFAAAVRKKPSRNETRLSA